MTLALLLLFLSAAVVPATTRYELLGRRFNFDAPSDGREAARTVTDTVGFLAFAVPRPGGDSAGPAVNVIISVVLSHRRWDLKTFGDAKLNQLEAGPGNTTVLDDHL